MTQAKRDAEPTQPVDARAAFESWLAVSQALVEDLPLDQILDVIAQVARDLTGNAYAMVALVNDQRDRLIVQGSAGLPPEYLAVTNDEHPLLIETPAGRHETPSVQAYRTGEPVVVLDPFADNTYIEYASAGHLQGYQGIISIPLAGPAELGVLTVYAPTANAVPPSQIDLLSALAKGAAAAIEIARLRQRELSMTAALEHVDRMHQRLTSVALADEGLDPILRSLSEMTGYDMLLEDGVSRRVIARWPAATPGPQLPAAELDALRAEVAASRSLVSWARAVGGETIYLAPIVITGDVAAHLWAIGGRRPMEDIQQRAFERGGLVVALELLKQRHASEVEWRMRGDILRDLLSLEPSDEALLLSRANAYGHDLSRPHVVLVVSPDPPSTSGQAVGTLVSERALQHVIACTRSVAAGLPGQPLVAALDGMVVMLLPEGQGRFGVAERAAKSIASAIALRGGQSATASVAVGDTCAGPLDYRLATQIATGALRLTQGAGMRNQVVNVADLGIFRLLLTVRDVDTLKGFADQVLDPLRRGPTDGRSADFIETLRSYLEHDLQPRQTAIALHVHPNTLAYRLRRIEELTGAPLRSSSGLLEMSFALAIDRLLHRP